MSGYCPGSSQIQCCIASGSPTAPTMSATSLGVDFSTSMSASVAQCLVKNGYSFVIPRGYQSLGSVDSSVCSSLIAAKNAGIRTRDAYIFPCPTCSSTAAQQVSALVTRLRTCNSAWSGRIWLDIEGAQYWSRSTTTNRDFYMQLVRACTHSGARCGVYASQSQWVALFGSASFSFGSNLPLWYAHYDGSPSFSDWSRVSFGGWSQPYAKQYKGDVTVCGLGVDLNYSPSFSGGQGGGQVTGGPSNTNVAPKTAPQSRPAPSNPSPQQSSLTPGVYTYVQSTHVFSGIDKNGRSLVTVNACSGALGYRDPKNQCMVAKGPLPVGSYRVTGPFTWKGMTSCFELDPFPSNRMCGRAGFLIHGGNCSPPYDPSEGCIVIQDPNTRALIKGGTILNVVATSAAAPRPQAPKPQPAPKAIAPPKTTSLPPPRSPATNQCSKAVCPFSACSRGCPCGPNASIVSKSEWCAKYSGWSQSSCECIMNAESGGNANVINQNRGGSYDVGLWQINDANWGQCNGGAAPCSPQANLNCAIKVFQWGGNTWKLWSTCSKCGVCGSK